MNDSAPTLTGLARQLVIAELIDERNAQQAQLQAQRNKMSLVTYLVQNKLVKSSQLLEIAADQFGVPFCNLAAIDKESQPRDLISEKLCRQHRVLPLYRRGNKLFIAISDPSNHQATTDVQFSTGLSTEALLVEDDKLGEAIEKFFDTGSSGMEDLADVDLDGLDVEAMSDDKEEAAGNDADDAPWCVSSIRCYWTPSRAARPTCTSSLMKRPTACAFAPTAFCTRWPAPPSSLPAALAPA